MKKSIGVYSNLFPMPVLMIATYDENETVNVMNMAESVPETWWP